MARIDTTQIEGYSEMSLEEKIAILEGFEYEDNKSEVERYKNAVTKANGEVAELKRKYNATLDEEQKKALEREEAQKQMMVELETLRKEKQLSDVKARFLGLGYDEDLALDSAHAYLDGDLDRHFANQKKFLEQLGNEIRASHVKSTPKPPAGRGEELKMTKEEFSKLSLSEKLKFSKEKPEEYKELYGG